MAYGLFIMDESFSKDFGETHWDFHKTHADNLINTNHPILNRYMTIWYENNADYRMKPAKVSNHSIALESIRIIVGLLTKRLRCGTLRAGNIFHSKANWLTIFRKHLQEEGSA